MLSEQLQVELFTASQSRANPAMGDMSGAWGISDAQHVFIKGCNCTRVKFVGHTRRSPGKPSRPHVRSVKYFFENGNNGEKVVPLVLLYR